MDKTEKFKNATRELDSQLARKIYRETYTAYSPTMDNGKPGHGIYYTFSNEKSLEVFQFIMERNGVPMEKHKSAMEKVPVLRISDRMKYELSESARGFLFSVNPDKIGEHLNQVIRDMIEQQNNRYYNKDKRHRPNGRFFLICMVVYL